MSKGFRYSNRAKSDLRRIFRDSALWFGPMQARRYTRGFDDACLALAAGDLVSRPLTVRGVSYRTRRVGSHILICIMNADDQLLVVRILHSRMDLQRHLPSA